MTVTTFAHKPRKIVQRHPQSNSDWFEFSVQRDDETLGDLNLTPSSPKRGKKARPHKQRGKKK